MQKNNFSQKLAELRKEHHYTQRFVASKIGTTARVYGYYEQGHFPATAEIIVRLCELYRIGANELLGIKIKYIYREPAKTDIYKNIQEWGEINE